MINKLKGKKIHFSLVLTLLVTYILMKCVDNYQYFMGVINVFLNILTPFVIAGILAYILNPIMKFFESRFNTRRTISLLMTYGVILLLIVVLILVTLPVIVNSIIDIVDKAPIYFNKTEAFIIQLSTHLENIDRREIETMWNKLVNMLPSISSLLIGSIGEIFKRTFSVGRFIVNFVLAFIICFYILLDKEKFTDFSKKAMFVFLGKKHTVAGLDIARTLNDNVGKYFTGKLVDSVIVGIISSIGLYLLKSQYSILFGSLMCIMNLIPYFGPALGMTPVVIINLFASPKIALFCLIYLILVQQVEVAFIEPKIVGGQLGLSPFFTILAVTIGGGFFGIPGMILSTPIMGVIKVYFTTYLDAKAKDMDLESEA